MWMARSFSALGSQDRERAHSLAQDVPLLAAAIGTGTPLLVTHNIRHFRSGEGVRVVRPRTRAKPRLGKAILWAIGASAACCSRSPQSGASSDRRRRAPAMVVAAAIRRRLSINGYATGVLILM